MAQTRTQASKDASNGARVPHYYALLTPLLHRRFARSAWTALSTCFLESIVLDDTNTLFWKLVPISTTAFKIVLLFMAILPVLILRVGQLSDLFANRSYSRSFRTICAYILSSWLYMQLYIWMFSADSNLGMVAEKVNFGRYFVNERYLYLTFYSIYCGLSYGISHLVMDRDYLDLTLTASDYSTALETSLPKGLVTIGLHTSIATCTAPFMYLIFRTPSWRLYTSFVGAFVRLHPDQPLTMLPTSPGLFIRSFFLGCMLFTVWEMTNVSFTASFSQDPVKHGITVSEKSTDPNASLVSGLKLDKKPLSKAMAFLELSYIAEHLPARRVLIFKDLSKPTSTWSEIRNECLGNISSITDCVHNAFPSANPSVSSSSSNQVSQTPQRSSKETLKSTVKEDNIWSTPPKPQVGQKWQVPPNTEPESIVLLEKFAKNIGGIEKVEQTMNSYLDPLLGSKYGNFFRVTVPSQTRLVFSNIHLHANAISSLSKFAVASLQEDEYGRVQKDIPQILATMYTALRSTEKYQANPPKHWTNARSEVKSTNYVLKEPTYLSELLLSSIREIGHHFKPYIKDMNLSPDVLQILDEKTR